VTSAIVVRQAEGPSGDTESLRPGSKKRNDDWAVEFLSEAAMFGQRGEPDAPRAMSASSSEQQDLFHR